MLRLLTASLFALTLAACGDDDGGADAATADAAAPDASGPDATTQSACMVLCGCATTYCDTRFPDMTDCMTNCAGLDSTVRSCRIEHCGYAQTEPVIHCPHVDGDETDPTTHPDCIQP